MSTRFDIRDAKEDYERHISTHKCAGINPDDPAHGFKTCDVRTALWLRWMRTAHAWGIEPGDDTRQRKQFFENYPNALRAASYTKAA